MPAVSDDIFKSVVFLFHNEYGAPSGTGFVVRRSAERLLFKCHYYAVTNHHVTDDGASTLRINTQQGSRFLPFAPNQWSFVQDGHDLCVIDITDHLTDGDDIPAIHESLLFKRHEVAASRVNIGENAFMVGLFTGNSRGRKNVPSAKFGNLSMLADESAPVEQGNKQRHPSHIVDMRSQPGFSGSPVFVYRTLLDHLDRLGAGHEGLHFSANRHVDAFFKLIGVHSGEFKEGVSLTSAEGEAKLDLWLPGSMTVVVPSWEIVELLDLAPLEAVRREREERWTEQKAGVPLVDKGDPNKGPTD